MIHILDNETINKIAAGEVVERPANVVKELIENSIDSGASAITCEIKDGGIALIRVTDNGCGIPPDEISKAFRRHATSKIEDEGDLDKLSTLGFRGEALSSIASVAQVEMITKVRGSITGIRAVNNGLNPNNTDVIPLETSEIGAPDGTTVIVRELFYNVPVRRKFLKMPQTEAGYITDLVEHLALSHPDISFHYRVNGAEKLHTSGNGDIKEIIYRIYGREISTTVLPVHRTDETGELTMDGFIGRPEISRGSRSFELIFVNGRVIVNDVLSKALESGYRTDLMQHQFPFAILYLTMPANEVDVNVHPSKKEARFSDNKRIFDFIDNSVHETLHEKELIPKAHLDSDKERKNEDIRERNSLLSDHEEPFEIKAPQVFSDSDKTNYDADTDSDNDLFSDRRITRIIEDSHIPAETKVSSDFEQLAMKILSPENASKYRILGQIFDTYWLIAFDDKLIMMDQHAAHEKVNYERLMKHYNERNERPAPSQQLLPAIVICFAGREESVFLQYQSIFEAMGYEFDDLGGSSYAIRAVPLELYGAGPEALLKDTIDEIMGEKLEGTPSDILSRIATESCKAAVKGNNSMRPEEAKALIDELMTLDNPYHCPHGRPTMIELSKQEIEKKFKRIV
ncbi:MAG: DNA mismatch repair endonuclease MutL [Lachnospiraceae bacterium]